MLSGAAGGTFRLGEFTVDPVGGEVLGPAGRERLDPKVMDVLLLLAARAGQVVSRQDLMASVWPGVIVGDDALSRCIYQLRRHLSGAGGGQGGRDLLETLPKRGYRLNCPPPPVVPWITGEARPVLGAAGRIKPPPVRARRVRWLASAAAALALSGAAALIGFDRSGILWRNPLAGASYTRLTDFDGAELQAAISRDGESVAFLSARDGPLDLWVSRIGSGRFDNLTQGRMPELSNPQVRTLVYSPDGAEIVFWTRLANTGQDPAPIQLWTIPSTGGLPRPYFEPYLEVAEMAWSPDGSRLLYHTPASGDPTFIAEPGEQVGRQIFVAPGGLHCHFPIWSPDGQFIYFVHGRVPDELDIWRLPMSGGELERITHHEAGVGYPVFLDDRTLLYLATAEDGSGPWLHALDIERGRPRRVHVGLQPYSSLAASEDGRRLVVTVTTSRNSLWRVPLTDRPAAAAEAVRLEVAAIGTHSPRLGPDYLLYLSPNDGTDGLWRLADDTITQLWDGERGRVTAGAAIERGLGRIAFPVALGDGTRLHVLDPRTGSITIPAPELDVRGAPAWTPDGRSIVIASDRGSGPQLFSVPLDGGRPMPIVDEYSIDGVWSPDGDLLVYRGAELGPAFPVKALVPGGEPRRMPGIMLPRGGERFAFLETATGASLVVLKGELQHKDFWLVDLATGNDRRLTDFGSQFVIGDFDLSPDGREIVFETVYAESDVLLIDLAAARRSMRE